MINKNNATSRVLWVDAVRGVAIVLMVVFHFCYDLRYFGYVDWDVPNGPNWWPFRYLILTLFIFTVGVSLSLAHAKKVRWKPFSKRLVQLLVASAAITIMSLFVFPNGWIYFGILHFIALASLTGMLFLRQPQLALCVGFGILCGYWLGLLPARWPFYFFPDFLPSYTEDFVPLFPWLGVALIGVGVAKLMPINKFDLRAGILVSQLIFIGRHGLVIYLVHQPLLFFAFSIFGYVV